MVDDSELTPSGWYPEPDDPALLRWWDGEDWTDDTMPAPAAVAAAPEPAAPEPAPPEAAATAAPLSADHVDQPAPIALVPGGPDRDLPPAVRGTEPTRRRTQPTDGSPRRRRDPAGAPPVDPARRPTAVGGDRPSPVGARRPAGSRPNVAGPAAARRPRPRPMEARPRPDGAEHRPSRMAAGPSPATAQAMLRVVARAGLLAVLVAIVWVGYLKVRDASPSDAATLSEHPAAVEVDKDAPRLEQVLLKLGDLPRGWEAQATDPSSDDICDGRIPRSVIEPTSVQSVAFTKGDSGALIRNVVQEFANTDTAKAFMSLTARVVDSCREYSTDQASIQLSPMGFPRFGDETFVAEASGDVPSGAIHGAIVYVRKANRVASVTTIAFGDTAVNTDLIEHLTDLVTHRLSTKPTVDRTIDPGRDGGGTLPGD